MNGKPWKLLTSVFCARGFKLCSTAFILIVTSPFPMMQPGAALFPSLVKRPGTPLPGSMSKQLLCQEKNLKMLDSLTSQVLQTNTVRCHDFHRKETPR